MTNFFPKKIIMKCISHCKHSKTQERKDGNKRKKNRRKNRNNLIIIVLAKREVANTVTKEVQLMMLFILNKSVSVLYCESPVTRKSFMMLLCSRGFLATRRNLLLLYLLLTACCLAVGILWISVAISRTHGRIADSEYVV